LSPNIFLVTTGLDPVVHTESPRGSDPDTIRLVRMDCRVKPGNDDAGELALGDFEA
jgi:hypothetical protein